MKIDLFLIVLFESLAKYSAPLLIAFDAIVIYMKSESFYYSIDGLTVKI